MPEHRAEQIINAVVKSIGLQTSAGKHVYRMTVRPLPEVPFAISVAMGPDDIELVMTNDIDSWLTVYLDLYTNSAQPNRREDATLASYETNLMKLRKETHVKMLADYTQDLTFVIDTDPVGALEPAFDGEGEVISIMVRTIWRIKYRTSLGDPSA